MPGNMRNWATTIRRDAPFLLFSLLLTIVIFGGILTNGDLRKMESNLSSLQSRVTSLEQTRMVFPTITTTTSTGYVTSTVTITVQREPPAAMRFEKVSAKITQIRNLITIRPGAFTENISVEITVRFTDNGVSSEQYLIPLKDKQASIEVNRTRTFKQGDTVITSGIYRPTTILLETIVVERD